MTSISINTFIKGGLPVTVECDYAPRESLGYMYPGAEPELIIKNIFFRSGHPFPMHTLSDDHITQLYEDLWNQAGDLTI